MKTRVCVLMALLTACSSSTKPQTDIDREAAIPQVQIWKEGKGAEKENKRDSIEIRSDNRIYYQGKKIKNQTALDSLMETFAETETGQYTLAVKADSTAVIQPLYQLLEVCTKHKIRFYLRIK